MSASLVGIVTKSPRAGIKSISRATTYGGNGPAGVVNQQFAFQTTTPVIYQNEDFEGGTNGATLTTVNTNFNPITANLTFTNSPVYTGSLAMQVTIGGTAAAANGHLIYGAGTVGVSAVSYSTFAINFAAIPAANTFLQQIEGPGSVLLADLRINAAGTITIRRGDTLVAVFTSTTVLSTATWYIIEHSYDADNQMQRLTIYNSTTGAVIEQSNWFTTGSTLQPASWWYGSTTAVANLSYTMDYIHVTDTPLSAPGTFPTAIYSYDNFTGTDTQTTPSVVTGVLLTNDLSEQPSGTAATTVNTAGAGESAFNDITATGGSVNFSNNWSLGKWQAFAVTGASSNTAWFSWTGLSDTQGTTSVYFNVGTTLPTVSVRLIDIRTGAATVVRLQTDIFGHLLIQDSSNTTLWTATNVLSTNTEYRFNLSWIVNGSGASTVNFDYYVGSSLTPVETGLATTTANLGTSAYSVVRYGMCASSTFTGTTYWAQPRFLSASTTYFPPIFIGTDSGTLTEVVSTASTMTTVESGALTEIVSLALTTTDTGTGAESTPTVAATLTAVTDSATIAETTYKISVAITDAGTATESATQAATASAIDSGTETDAYALATLASDLAALADTSFALAATLTTVTDSATLTETPKLALAATDTGSGSESTSIIVAVPVSDSGSGSDTSISSTATVTTTDSGTGADTTITLVENFSSPDSGAATETVSSASTLTTTDTATGNDGPTDTIAQSASDSGTCTETTAITAAVPTSDSGTASESTTILGAYSSTDSATLFHSNVVNATVTTTDSATGTETFSIALSATDSATVTETVSSTTTLSTAESGSASDTATFIALSSVDSGAGSDSTAIIGAYTGSDSGTATETASTAATVTTTDSATITETPKISVSTTDTGSLTETPSIAATVTDYEYPDLFSINAGWKTGVNWRTGGTGGPATLATGVTDPLSSTNAFSITYPNNALSTFAAPPVWPGQSVSFIAPQIQPNQFYIFTSQVKSGDGTSFTFNYSIEDFSGTGGIGVGYFPTTVTTSWQTVALVFKSGTAATINLLYYSLSGIAATHVLDVFNPQFAQISAAEAASLIASNSAIDAGTESDTPKISLSTSDSGTATETAALSVTLTALDSGVANDGPADANSLSATDSGTGTDTTAVVGIYTGTDSATATETTATISVALTATDSGTATETQAVSTLISSSDSAIIAENTSIAVTTIISSSDAGTRTETQSIVATATTADSAVGTDTASSTSATTTSDSATIAETTYAVAVSTTDACTGNDGVPYSPLVLSDSPIGYWHLDETSGTVATDSSGHSYNGVITPTNVIYSQPGALKNNSDTALGTNGAGTSAVEFGSVTLSGDFTLETWVNFTAQNTFFMSIFNLRNTSTLDMLQIDTAPGTPESLRARIDSPSHINQIINAASNKVGDGQWHHVILTYVRATSAASLYFDGAQAGVTLTVVNGSAIGTTFNHLSLFDNSGSYGTSNPIGTVDEAAIYAYALSPTQIKNHYLAGIQNYSLTTSQSGTDSATATESVSIVASVSPLSPGDPLGITGLISYFDALRINSNNAIPADQAPIATWIDLSTQQLNATQAVGTSQPLYQITGAITPNGAPSVKFDGINDYLATVASTLYDSLNLSIYYIAKTDTTSTTYRPLFGHYVSVAGDLTWDLAMYNASTGNGLRATARGTLLGAFASPDINVSSTTNLTWTIGSWLIANTGTNLFVNGTNVGSSAAARDGGTSPGVGLDLGQRGDGVAGFGGEIATLVVFNGTHTTLQRQQIEQYLGSRYGIGSYVDVTNDSAQVTETAVITVITSDSASLTESNALSASVSTNDSASGTETSPSAISVSTNDTGTINEVSSTSTTLTALDSCFESDTLVNLHLSVTDAGFTTETQNISAVIATSDVCTATDTAFPNILAPDTATLSESQNIVLSAVNDTATLNDTLTSSISTLNTFDSATLNEAAGIGGTFVLSDSDARSSAETSTVNASVSTSDSANIQELSLPKPITSENAIGAEANSVSAVITTSDSGNIAEIPSLSVNNSDSGSILELSFEAAVINTADSGATTDVFAIGVNATDSGLATESTSLLTSRAVTDSGASSDSDTLQANLSVVDSGLGTDTAQSSSSVSTADSGTFNDVSSTSATTTTTDTGTATQQTTVNATINTADSANISEIPSIAVFSLDSGIGTDAQVVGTLIVGSDSATITETVTVVTVFITDIGTLAETATYTATITTSDSAIGNDGPTDANALTTTDSGTATETTTVTTLQTSTDSGTATDGYTLNATVPTNDSGTILETSTLNDTVITSDTAQGFMNGAINAVINASDNGTLNDGPPVITQAHSANDSGNVVELNQTVSNNVSFDNGNASETVVINVSLTVTDTASDLSQNTVFVIISASDPAFYIELTPVISVGTPTVGTIDSGHLTESTSITEAIASSDDGVLREAQSIEVSFTLLNAAVLLEHTGSKAYWSSGITNALVTRNVTTARWVNNTDILIE